MISVKKLYTLKERTQIRKCSAIFHQAAMGDYNIDYLIEVFNVLYSEKSQNVLNEDFYLKLNKLRKKLLNGNVDYIIYEDISQLLLKALGSEPSDWDFYTKGGELDQNKREVFQHNLIIDRIRAPFNIGSIFRSADSFGVNNI